MFALSSKYCTVSYVSAMFQSLYGDCVLSKTSVNDAAEADTYRLSHVVVLPCFMLYDTAHITVHYSLAHLGRIEAHLSVNSKVPPTMSTISIATVVADIWMVNTGSYHETVWSHGLALEDHLPPSLTTCSKTPNAI
jgi:hypothetical protein